MSSDLHEKVGVLGLRVDAHDGRLVALEAQARTAALTAERLEAILERQGILIERVLDVQRDHESRNSARDVILERVAAMQQQLLIELRAMNAGTVIVSQ